MHRRVKRVVGRAHLLAGVKKPNVMVTDCLDSGRGRRIMADDSDDHIIKDFAAFKRKHNPELFL